MASGILRSGGRVQRLIVTGANGAGKSHVAARLSAERPDIPLVSFDSIKLLEGWRQRPRPEIDAKLSRVVAGEAWILEGGPSLLRQALPRAQAVLWLDPPEVARAWRLMIRPWRTLGRTRPELPEGNPDWPLQQYRFAIRSLRNGARFRRTVADALDGANVLEGDMVLWQCRTARQVDAAIHAWGRAAGRAP